MRSRYWGAIWMALAASIWGGMYVVSKIVLATVQPLMLLWLRYIVGLAALVLVLLVTRQPWRMRWRDALWVAAIGIVGYVISIWAQFLGTKLSSAQLGAMITSATPAFMVVFGRLLLGEKITVRRGISVVIATLGVLLIVGVGGVGRNYQAGGLILLLAALAWALMSVLVKRVPGRFPPLLVTTYAILIATIVVTPLSLRQWQGLSVLLSHPILWGGVLYLGIISTAGAFFLWNQGLKMVDASSGGLYFFFQPLVGTFLGWLVLGEQVSWTFWVGAAFIVLGVLLVIRE
ncbi:DMT family transporter [Sulfobacillus harzensis]|uniref:DMT family transporter n=1 Tax=Sulfobacillus harzensis TaxID=2729629 RepID=A0A7Y0Q4F3_9FIRM|nr:DMT family transporter [Sulfobacillus harzensis]NMP23956.1 DMT family transporter [Sulfobacillus harzensis]